MQSNGQTSKTNFDTLAEQVVSIMASVKQVPRDRISLDSAFHELGLDSLDTVTLLSELEEHFKIAISNEDARAIVRVRDAVERIQRLRVSLSDDGAPQAGTRECTPRRRDRPRRDLRHGTQSQPFLGIAKLRSFRHRSDSIRGYFVVSLRVRRGGAELRSSRPFFSGQVEPTGPFCAIRRHCCPRGAARLRHRPHGRAPGKNGCVVWHINGWSD